MNPSQPNELLAVLDADITRTRERLEKLMACREQVVAIYAGAPAPETPTPAPTVTGRRPAKFKFDRRKLQQRRPRGASATANERSATVLAWLGRQKAPVAIADVIAGAGVSKYHAQLAIKALLKSHDIQSTGVRSHYRIAVPAVMAAAKEGL